MSPIDPIRRCAPTGRTLIAGALLLAACAPGPDRPASFDPRAGTEDDPSILFASDRERNGLRVYRRENCGRCHTLFHAPPPSGAIVPPAPFEPGLLSRTGPDLGMEGHLRSDDWHLAHLYAPAVVVRGSRMPASRHLFTRSGSGRPVPSSDARDLVAFLQALGRGRGDVWAAFRMREPEIPEPPPVDRSLLDRAGSLFRRHCASCHGERGDGRGEAAGLLGTPPRDLKSGRYRFKSVPFAAPPADSDLFRIITLGTGTGAAMPSFAGLSADDRWALVLAVKEIAQALAGRTLSAPGSPADAAAGDRDPSAAAGRELWDALACVSCHDPSEGRGEASRGIRDQAAEGGIRAPGSLRHACDLRGGASEAALERAFTLGIGLSMPAFGDALADRNARRALVHYLRERLREGSSGRRRPIGARSPG